LDLWKRFSTDDDRFDLHDFVKAHCAPRGLTSQFLNEHTLTEQQQCRVWWWLSLALYVKSMRTPWVLDALDGDTAFVGLGFSIDRTAKRGRHVVLGCSHIYNARGEGLQYRLARIEDPQIRRGNPFMSRDDARRTGETIRQLFFESRMRLPRRVVVHKQTHFLRDEREGLLEGLGGVDEVDMLEIQIDSALRYVASMPRPGGKFSEDNYPVRRGSVVKLDANSALLWVHGVAADLNPSFKYYQGKRRIPAPLLVKRHAGKADLELICSEILGLSKMDWNSFDLYTKMPSTVESSGRIAQIGALLDRFGATGYDYRLFI
jgi:argonaute-like protein implicated in RNA metabolism and viral defense